jgi:cephalosporin hydroxylase
MFRDMPDSEAIEYVRSHVDLPQDDDEILNTMAAIQMHVGIATIALEIGNYYGGGLCILSRLLSGSGLLIGIDPELQVPLDVEWVRTTIAPVEFTHINGYSTDPDVYSRLSYILSGRSIDVLMIDGDHSSEDVVRSDYNTYSPLVSSPGAILFHDIRDQYERAPGLIFDSVKLGHNYREFITDASKMGTGLILC